MLQGILLQIFTKPLGDRPTVFFEIIERLCVMPDGKVGGQAAEWWVQACGHAHPSGSMALLFASTRRLGMGLVGGQAQLGPRRLRVDAPTGVQEGF